MYKSLRASVRLASLATTERSAWTKVSQPARALAVFASGLRQPPLPRTLLASSSSVQIRGYASSSSGADDVDFDKFQRPKANDPFKWISTRIQIAFHMFMIDKQFSYKEFSDGAMQAVLLVSDLISKGRVNELESLLHPKIFQSVKKSIESRKDRKEALNLIQNRTDVSQQVPAGISVRKSGDRTVVDIETVFYILPNAQQLFQEMFSQNKTGYKDIGQLVTEKAQIAHYVFRREYGPDVSGTDWIIIYLRHHAVKDLE